jgi:hypothetical protein
MKRRDGAKALVVACVLGTATAAVWMMWSGARPQVLWHFAHLFSPRTWRIIYAICIGICMAVLALSLARRKARK